ncbi:MAG: AtpZ/AtpI family protein [bacterium]|nr:AtpZ/AtpI family protein [bacterium]
MENKEIREILYYFGLVTQVGFTMVGSILVGFGIGYCLDKYFKLGKLILVFFIFIGIGAGFYNAYKLIMSKEKK